VKIGLLVDDQGGQKAFNNIRQTLTTPPNQLVGVVHVNLHPLAQPGKIVHVASKKLDILRAKGAVRCILALNHETRPECPAAFSSNLQNLFHDRGHQDVSVVVKNWCLENWLVADIDALAAMKGHFDEKRIASIKSAISPDKADNVDALQLLKDAARKQAYHKTNDPQRIMQHYDVLRAARNSRSLRRLLHLAGHQAYADQSRKPFPA